MLAEVKLSRPSERSLRLLKRSMSFRQASVNFVQPNRTQHFELGKIPQVRDARVSDLPAMVEIELPQRRQTAQRFQAFIGQLWAVVGMHARDLFQPAEILETVVGQLLVVK